MAIKPSPCLVISLLLFHALAVAAVYLAAIPVAAKLALFAPVLSSLGYCLVRDALLLLPASWCEVSLDHERASVATRNGLRFTGKISGKTTVTPFFVVLGIVPEGHHRPVFQTIFPDALAADAFRDLRVHLRYCRERR